MNAAIYRFAPYTGSLKIEQQTFCLVHSLFQFVWLSEDVYIIPPAFHSVKYFFKKFLTLLTVQAAVSLWVHAASRVQKGRSSGWTFYPLGSYHFISIPANQARPWI